MRDLRAARSLLAEGVGEQKERAGKTFDGRLDGEALDPVVHGTQPLGEHVDQLERGVRRVPQLREDVDEGYLHDLARLERDGLLEARADAEAQLA